MLAKQYPVLFFDGDCLLCSRVVQWIIKNDRKGFIYFCTLADGRKAGIDGLENDTVVLWHQHQIYQKSKAVAEVLKLVGGFYRIIGYIISFFPRFIPNTIYDFVAKNRYDWFGQRNNCLIPNPLWSYRILNSETLNIEIRKKM
jgi:predicted DCC family thiol-disulfide oxidoreductase YuxK